MEVRKIFRIILTSEMSQKRVSRKTQMQQLENMSKTIDLKFYLNDLIQKSNLPTTPFGKSFTRNLMIGTEQLAHISLPTEISGSVK